MDSLETGETCNQTIFDFYDSYLHEYKQIVDYHLNKYRQEFVDYFHQNAQHLAIAIIVYVMFSFCFYCFIMRTKLARQIGTINNCKSILFVTSHPDDECMFFGPTIVSLSSKPGTSVYLLCLSTGNHYNLGRIRKDELFESCKILGIPEANIQILNCTSLPDDPKVSWNQETVAEIILNFIETYSIDTVRNLLTDFSVLEIIPLKQVITFDRYGVSSHPNHISIFYAMAYLCLEKKLPRTINLQDLFSLPKDCWHVANKNLIEGWMLVMPGPVTPSHILFLIIISECTAYALESVSKLRKYVAYLDIPLTCLLSSKKYVVPMEKRNLIREAMKAHQSQFVWFRKLYMIFSRYVFINSYKEINVLELEMEFVEDGN